MLLQNQFLVSRLSLAAHPLLGAGLNHKYLEARKWLQYQTNVRNGIFKWDT